MLRKMFVLLCGLGLVATLSGCSSSDGSDETGSGDFTTPYAFAGTWTFARTVTEDPVGWSADDRDAPLGTTYNSTFVITANGTAVVADDLTAPYPPETYSGVADLSAGSTTLVYRYNSGSDPSYIVSTFQLQAESDTTMTGTWVSDEHPSPGFPSGKHMEQTIVATRK